MALEGTVQDLLRPQPENHVPSGWTVVTFDRSYLPRDSVCECECTQLRYGGQRSTSSGFLSHSLPYFLKQGLSYN